MVSTKSMFTTDKLILMVGIGTSLLVLQHAARTAGIADGQLERILIAVVSSFIGYGAQQLYLFARKGNA